jgi:tRNA-dihydrouridine synthase
MDVCKLHLDRLIALKGETVAVREMRKHAAWYLKGIRGNAIVRNAINTMDTRDELVNLLDEFTLEVEAKQQNSIQAG